jgi:hypothetical protein
MSGPSSSVALVPASGERNAFFRRAPPLAKPTTTRRREAPRNALARRRQRNASGLPARSTKPTKPAPTASPVGNEETTRTSLQRFVDTFLSVASSGGTSLVGGLASKYGVFKPWVVTGGVSALGFLGSWYSRNERRRQIYSGIACTGVSQIVLMMLNNKPKEAEQSKPAAATTQAPAPPPGIKNADLSMMPADVLDAAFERARAQLALEDECNATPYYHTNAHMGPHMPLAM